MEDSDKIHPWEVHLHKQLTCIDMLASGTEAVVCGREVLRIISIRGGCLDIVHNLRGSKKRENQQTAANVVSAHPVDPHVLATGAVEGGVAIWNTQQQRSSAARFLSGHNGKISSIQWHPRETQWVMTASYDGEARIWDARVASSKLDKRSKKARQSGSPADAFIGEEISGGSGSVLPAYGGENGCLALRRRLPQHHSKTRLSARPVQSAGQQQSGLCAAAWSPHDDSLVLTGSLDGMMRLWDIRKPEQAVQFWQPHSHLASLAWHPRWRGFVATCDRRAHSVHLWDLKQMAGWQGGYDSPHPLGGTHLEGGSKPATTMASGGGPSDTLGSAVPTPGGGRRMHGVVENNTNGIHGFSADRRIRSVPKPLFKLPVGEGGPMVWRPGADCDLLVADSTIGSCAHLWRLPMRGLPVVSVGSGLQSIAGAAWVRNLRCAVPQESLGGDADFASARANTRGGEWIGHQGKGRSERSGGSQRGEKEDDEDGIVKQLHEGHEQSREQEADKRPHATLTRHAGTPALASDGKWIVRGLEDLDPAWAGVPGLPVGECGAAVDAWGHAASTTTLLLASGDGRVQLLDVSAARRLRRSIPRMVMDVSSSDLVIAGTGNKSRPAQVASRSRAQAGGVDVPGPMDLRGIRRNTSSTSLRIARAGARVDGSSGSLSSVRPRSGSLLLRRKGEQAPDDVSIEVRLSQPLTGMELSPDGSLNLPTSSTGSGITPSRAERLLQRAGSASLSLPGAASADADDLLRVYRGALPMRGAAPPLAPAVAAAAVGHALARSPGIVFARLARELQLEGASARDLCFANAKTCNDVGVRGSAASWRALGLSLPSMDLLQLAAQVSPMEADLGASVLPRLPPNAGRRQWTSGGSRAIGGTPRDRNQDQEERSGSASAGVARQHHSRSAAQFLRDPLPGTERGGEASMGGHGLDVLGTSEGPNRVVQPSQHSVLTVRDAGFALEQLVHALGPQASSGVLTEGFFKSPIGFDAHSTATSNGVSRSRSRLRGMGAYAPALQSLVGARAVAQGHGGRTGLANAAAERNADHDSDSSMASVLSTDSEDEDAGISAPHGSTLDGNSRREEQQSSKFATAMGGSVSVLSRARVHSYQRQSESQAKNHATLHALQAGVPVRFQDETRIELKRRVSTQSASSDVDGLPPPIGRSRWSSAGLSANGEERGAGISHQMQESNQRHAGGGAFVLQEQYPRTAPVWAAAIEMARAAAAARTVGMLARVRERLLRRTLRYYARLGDVQMCVSISRVFGRDATSLCGRRRMRQWVQCYVDLLHRSRLWSPASTIMARAVDASIRKTNQDGTIVSIGCAKCGESIVRSSQPDAVAPPQLQEQTELLGFSAGQSSSSTGSTTAAGAALCANCKEPRGTCSLCEQAVRGPFVWCQVCGHGGHLEHMTAWFASSSECPAGCGHACDLGSTQPPLPKPGISGSSGVTGAWNVSQAGSMGQLHTGHVEASHPDHAGLHVPYKDAGSFLRGLLDPVSATWACFELAPTLGTENGFAQALAT